MSRLFSLIRKEEVHLTSNKKVVPLEDFTVLVEAHEILEKARADSDNLLKETQQQCAELKAAAEKEGYQEGLQQLNAQILGLDQEKKRLRHEMNKLILPLALKAAKKIVAKELETHPNTIADIVLQALIPVLQDPQITIWVNKVDRETLEAERPRLKEKLEHVETLLIKERDDISAGGCIIEAKSGIVNATIENQWRAITSALEKYTSP